MTKSIEFSTRAALVSACGSPVNTDLSIIADCSISDRGEIKTSYYKAVDNHRTMACIEYVDTLFRFFAQRAFSRSQRICFALDGGDRLADIPCASWQRQKEYRNVLLLPDFYYTRAQGYRDFPSRGFPAWQDRRNEILWRGSTTGGFDLSISTLDALPRYKMARILKDFGFRADVGFHDVVQASNEGEESKIRERLQAEDLFRGHVGMDEFVRFKFIVQMDGNGNSWELVRKLRTGCCMLLVDSPWVLWHNTLLRPWEHFVPVAHDLSDLAETLTWCFNHDDETKNIAARAMQLVNSIDYDQEMIASLHLLEKFSSLNFCDVDIIKRENNN